MPARSSHQHPLDIVALRAIIPMMPGPGAASGHPLSDRACKPSF